MAELISPKARASIKQTDSKEMKKKMEKEKKRKEKKGEKRRRKGIGSR